jgi:hypothetical protein
MAVIWPTALLTRSPAGARRPTTGCMLNTTSRSILEAGRTGVTLEAATGVRVAFCVGVAVGVQVGVAVGVGVGVSVGVSVAVGDAVGVVPAVGVAVGGRGVGVDRIASRRTMPVSSMAVSGNANKPNQIAQRRRSFPIRALCVIDQGKHTPRGGRCQVNYQKRHDLLTKGPAYGTVLHTATGWWPVAKQHTLQVDQHEPPREALKRGDIFVV